MSGIYIPNIEQPEYCAKCFAFDAETCECNLGVKRTCNPFDGRYDRCTVFPVPDHGRLMRVLKTERECVSRECDRDCGKCNLSLDRDEILTAYDELILLFEAPTVIPAEKEGHV